MKKPILLLLLLMAFSFTNCSDNAKEDLVDEVPCEEGCLFSMKKAEGSIIFMECFQKYAIQTKYPDDETLTIYGIPESISEEYHEEGKSVTFSAAFRENTLVPQFPDPSFNMESLFEIELILIE